MAIQAFGQGTSPVINKKPEFTEYAPGLFSDGFNFEVRRCPASPREWQDWLTQVAQKTTFDTRPLPSFPLQVFDRCLKQPQEAVHVSPQVVACLDRLNRLVDIERPDSAEANRWRYEKAAFPKELATREIFDFFFDANGQSRDPAQVRKAPKIFDELRNKGWSLFEDQGFMRSPGPPYRFFNFSNASSFVDVIYASPRSGGVFDFAAAEYVLEPQGAEREISIIPKTQATFGSCITCHHQGLIGVTGKHPHHARLPAQAAHRSFNEFIYSMGRPDFGQAWTLPKSSVPTLGSDDPSIEALRSDEFLERCAGPFKPERRQANIKSLRKAMRCQSCHDDQDRPRLIFPFQPHITPKEPLAPGKRRMPPHALSDDPKEDKKLREGLETCLSQEYYGSNGLLARWITEVPCDAKTDLRGGGQGPQTSDAERKDPQRPSPPGTGTEKPKSGPGANQAR